MTLSRCSAKTGTSDSGGVSVSRCYEEGFLEYVVSEERLISPLTGDHGPYPLRVEVLPEQIGGGRGEPEKRALGAGDDLGQDLSERAGATPDLSVLGRERQRHCTLIDG